MIMTARLRKLEIILFYQVFYIFTSIIKLQKNINLMEKSTLKYNNEL